MKAKKIAVAISALALSAQVFAQTNIKGLEIEAIPADSTNYAIYSASDAKSFFKGEMAIGDSVQYDGISQLSVRSGHGNWFALYDLAGNKYSFHNAAANNHFAIATSSVDSTVQEVFTLSPDGKVGVRTASPESELAVNGTITATQVVVKDVLGGSDFVFEENYKLRSLEEVEAFVRANKHLPEIASAKEMSGNGVNMAGLQMQLLQKIEELTLYVIAQEKRLNELIRENKALLKDEDNEVE